MGMINEQFYELGKHAKSDDLPRFMELFSAIPFSINFEVFNVVLDTNFILQDLRSMSKNKRNKLNYRTDIVECIQAGVFIAYITRQVEGEVEAKIEIVSKKWGITREALLEEWHIYKRLLRKRKISEDLIAKFGDAPDVDDVPSVILAYRLKALLFTENMRDFVPVSDRVVDGRDLSKESRDYARKMSVALWVEGNLIYFGTVSINAFYQAVSSIIATIIKGPGVVKFLTVLFLIIILISPELKQKIISYARSLFEKIAAQDWSKIYGILSQVHRYTEMSIPDPPVPQFITDSPRGKA